MKRAMKNSSEKQHKKASEARINQAHKRRTVVLICTALVVATFIAYEPMRRNDFVNNFDDDCYITENPHIRAGITGETVSWAFTKPHCNMWHPLTSLSHALDYQLFGLNPLWHHLMNLLFHAASTLLLFWFLKKTTGAVWPSAFVAAAFALHPLQVESVAWASERKNVLSGFFWLLTMLAYARYAERPGIIRYLPITASFCLGLLSKPMLVTLPFALFLLDYWPLERCHRRNLHRLVFEKVPLFILSAVLCVVTFLSQQGGEVVKKLPLNIRIENAIISYVSYIGKMIYPSRLAAFYPHPLASLPIWKPIVYFLILIVILIVFLYLCRRKRFLTVGWLWYLGTLVPVIGLVQVGTQAMADRYTYLPSIGIFIIVAWGSAELIRRWRYRKAVLGILAGVVLTILFICTRTQVKYWQNNITLFKHGLEVTTNNATMHERYANTIVKEGKFEEALEHYRQALHIRPELVWAHAGMGVVFFEQGKLDEAIECFEAALQLRPNAPFVLNNLGVALEAQGKNDKALESFNRAVQSNPDYPLSYYNIAKLKTQQKKYDQAIEYYEAALKRKPYWPKAYSELGEVYFSIGDINQAVRYWRRAIELNPNDIKTLNNLAWVLATTEDAKIKNPAEAIKYAERIVALLGPYQQPVFLDTLAIAYASAGNFSKAIKVTEDAIKLCEAAGKKEAAEKMRGRLELYKSGRTYRKK